MKSKKLQTKIKKLTEYSNGIPIIEDNWEGVMKIVTDLEVKGFTIVMTNNSTGIWDANNMHDIVGFTKDKDAEGRWQSAVSALYYLVTTHSLFKD